MSAWPDSSAGQMLRQLERHFGPQESPPCSGPFEMILWEIVAYLADDSRRTVAFTALREQVGLTPPQILAAPIETLRVVTRLGGPIAADDRAARLKTAAELVQNEFGSELSAVLRLPTPKAKKQLMRFPMIGEPGAEKILLFCGALSVLPLESNGLRVFVRYGIGEERHSYASTYKSVREATLEQLPSDNRLLTTAYLLAPRHGQELCLRNGPACGACPVNAECRYAAETSLN